VFSDIGPNKKLQQDLQQDLHQLAYFDPLTNLPNQEYDIISLFNKEFSGLLGIMRAGFRYNV
jgi:GGDEF domain-containing protein